MKRHDCKYAPFEMEANENGYWVRYDDALYEIDKTKETSRREHIELLQRFCDRHKSDKNTIKILYISNMIILVSLFTSIFYLIK